MTLRVFEAFSGIGTQRMALKNLGIEHEVVAISEIDKFAIKSYEAIHGETNNLGDIVEINSEDVPDHDLFTYSFPCQDISVAGNLKGFEKDSGTRSSLLWECYKIIEAKKPKYLLMENVKNLVGKKFKPHFDEWLEVLEDLGYSTYWQVLNAKHYGVPQNRERVFAVSVWGNHEPYKFPQKQELKLRLKDILEDEVDEKFYLSEEKTKELTFNLEKDSSTVSFNRKSGVNKEIDVAHTVNSSDWRGLNRNQNQNAVVEPKINQSEGLQPSVTVKNATKKGYVEAKEGDGVDLAYPDSKTRRGRVQKDKAHTLTTDDSKGVVENLRIRKLTPKECWRLMGISDEDFYKAAYKTKQITFEEDNEEWNVRLKDVTGNQKPDDTETFVLSITDDSNEQVETSTEWKRYLKMPGNENKQSVNIVIEKLAELGRLDYATNIIKCTENMETLLTLTEENDQLQEVIIELDETVSTNTAKYMRITSVDNLNPLKLYIILTLTKQITESKTFTSTLQQVSICGFIENMNISEKNTENQLKLSLKADATFTRNSASQLYKQAGNAIVVNVLEEIFKGMF